VAQLVLRDQEQQVLLAQLAQQVQQAMTVQQVYMDQLVPLDHKVTQV
jgi:hypothetical protein